MRTGSVLRPLAACAALILWAASAVAADARPKPNPLLGSWHSVGIPPGEVGTVFQFEDGGVLRYSPAAIVSMRYRVDGQELILSSEDGAEPDQRQTMEWLDGGRLRLKSTTGTIELSRRSSNGADLAGTRSILGSWTAPRDVGDGQTVEAVYVFDGNGKTDLIVPTLTTRGRYGIDGDKIHLSVPGRWAEEGTFRVEKDTLVVTIPDSKGVRELRLRRY